MLWAIKALPGIDETIKQIVKVIIIVIVVFWVLYMLFGLAQTALPHFPARSEGGSYQAGRYEPQAQVGQREVRRIPNIG